MRFSLYKGRVEIERNVRPPIRAASTVPVYIDGRDSGVAIYVAASAFSTSPLPQQESVIRAVVEALELRGA